MKVKEILHPAAVLVVICLVVTFCLAGTNLLTRGRIAEAKRQAESASQKAVLPQAGSFEDAPDRSCTVGKAGNRVVGYVFVTKTKSYGGDLSVMTGIDRSGNVTGTELLSSSDTPGLGLNAEKESFRSQYKQPAPPEGFAVVKSKTGAKGEIDAITSATITSKAYTSCVNQAIKEFKKVKGSE